MMDIIPGDWLRTQVLEADRLGNAGRFAEADELITKALQPLPRRLGTADAYAVLAGCDYRAGRQHAGEIACLQALRFAGTFFFDRDSPFDTLVNLSGFCLAAKSFEEARDWGLRAERLKQSDPELSANLVMAAGLAGREEEAQQRHQQLCELDPLKAATVGAYFRCPKDGGRLFQRTRDLDCSGILDKLHQAAGCRDLRGFLRGIAELETRPDGKLSFDCWNEIRRAYAEIITTARTDESVLAYAHAGVAAASGKAINAARESAAKDLELWRSRGEAFAYLRIFDLAIEAFSRALELAPADGAVAGRLEYCQSIASVQSRFPDTEAVRDYARRHVLLPGALMESMDLFMDVVRYVDRSPTDRVREAADLHVRGYDLYETDELAALALLCEAAANFPEWPPTWRELSVVLRNLQRHDEAEICQRYAVELERPTNSRPGEAERFAGTMAQSRQAQARAAGRTGHGMNNPESSDREDTTARATRSRSGGIGDLVAGAAAVPTADTEHYENVSKNVPAMPRERERLLREVQPGGEHIASVAWSPDGKLLAAGTRGTVHLLTPEGRLVRQLEGPRGVTFWGVDFSPDGQKLVAGGDYAAVRLWDVTTGRMLHRMEGHTDDVQSVAYSADGYRVASASHDGTVRVWDADTGACRQVLAGRGSPLHAVVYSPQADWVATAAGASQEAVCLWDTVTGELLETLQIAPCWSLTVDGTGSYIAAGLSAYRIEIWDVARRERVTVFEGHTGVVSAVAFRPDGKLLASGSWDKTLRLWSIEEARELEVLTGHTDNVCSVAFSPDGSHVASACYDGSVRLWNTADLVEPL